MARGAFGLMFYEGENQKTMIFLVTGSKNQSFRTENVTPGEVKSLWRYVLRHENVILTHIFKGKRGL